MLVIGPLAAVLSALASCSSPEKSPAEPASTPLASFATDSITVARGDFCDRIGASAIERAVGKGAESAPYGSGDPTELEPDLVDLSHEFGCRFHTEEASARAWVFAPPISTERARQLVTQLAGMKRCVRLPQAPTYGAPSVALACGEQSKPTLWFAGLFGDAWLTCTLQRSLPGPELLDETGRWCVAVAQAAAE